MIGLVVPTLDSGRYRYLFGRQTSDCIELGENRHVPVGAEVLGAMRVRAGEVFGAKDLGPEVAVVHFFGFFEATFLATFLGFRFDGFLKAGGRRYTISS